MDFPTSISPATLADCRAIAEVHVLSWQHAYRDLLPADYLAALSVERREATWREAIGSGTPRLLVARVAVERSGDAHGRESRDLPGVLPDVLPGPSPGVFQSISGFIAFGRSRDADAAAATAEIWAIYVAPSLWARGVGRALWLAAREELRHAGFGGVSLWVIAGNAAARRFYAAAGFAAEPGSTKSFTLGGTQLEEVRYVRIIEHVSEHVSPATAGPDTVSVRVAGESSGP